MQSYPYWALTGWGLASWVMMLIFWRPDPPPFGKYLGTSIAGIAGGVFGGIIATLASSDPMPGFLGAAVGAVSAVGVVRVLLGSGGVTGAG